MRFLMKSATHILKQMKHAVSWSLLFGLLCLVPLHHSAAQDGDLPTSTKEFLGFSDIMTGFGDVYGYNGTFSAESYRQKLGALPHRDAVKVFKHYAGNYAFEMAYKRDAKALKEHHESVADMSISQMTYPERQLVDAVTMAIDKAVDGGEIMIYPEDMGEIMRFVPLALPQNITASNQIAAFDRLNALVSYASKKSKVTQAALKNRVYKRPEGFHKKHDGEPTGYKPQPISAPAEKPSPVRELLFETFKQQKLSFVKGECTDRERRFGAPGCDPLFGSRFVSGASPTAPGGGSCSPDPSDPQSCSEGPMPRSSCGQGLTHPPLGGNGRLDDGIGASRGGGSRSHAGIDMSVAGTGGNDDCGAPIYAARSGFVSRCETIDGNLAGNIVVIDHCDGKFTRYFHLRPGRFLGGPAGAAVEDNGNHGGGHCAPFGLTVGRFIPGGQQIAELGRSCSYVNPSMSCHLHFELRSGAYGGSTVHDPNQGSCLQDLEDGSTPVTTCLPGSPGSPSATETELCGGMDAFKEALGIAEGSGDYCKVGGGGNNYVGKYQFNQATLGDESRVPSSCYSGCRNVKDSCFKCNGPAQEEAFSCYFEQNKKLIDADIKRESGGRYNNLSEYMSDPDNPYMTTNANGERCVQQKSDYYYNGCQKRLNNGTTTKKGGPSCLVVTESGVYGAAHLIGPGRIGDMLVDGENAYDGFCTSSFHYGEKFRGIDVNDEAGEGEEGQVCTPREVPNEPLPGDDDDDEYEPDEVVPGTPGFGSGDEDKGIKAQIMEGGLRNFEASTFSKPGEGDDYEKGTKATDDRSAQELATGASQYKTEEDFDFSKTMAWIEDFEQHIMLPNWGIWPSKTCLYWKPKKFGIKTALLPACSVKLNYSEPTAMVEVVGEHGMSYLGELEDFTNKSNHSDGGVGLAMSGLGVGFNQAHVFGISPNARTESSGSEKTVRRSFACDIAVSGIDTWENMTLHTPPRPNVDAEGGVPDKLFTMGIPGATAILNPTYRFKWYMGAEDKGKDTELPLLFASEEHYPEWVTKEGTLGEVRADDVPCDQDGRINPDTMTSDTMPNKSDKRCVGSWGLLEPMNGFASNGTDMANKAIVAARAYTIARQEKIYPMMAPASTTGNLIPKIEYAHIGWKYWYTDFNIEWPYEGKQRFMLGEDSFNWDSVLMRNNYKSRGLSQWLSMNLDDAYGGEAAAKDGLVMTLWKRTTCRIYACCHRWSYDPSWRLFTFFGFQKKWELKGITEIDDWETEHSKDYNPPRL